MFPFIFQGLLAKLLHSFPLLDRPGPRPSLTQFIQGPQAFTTFFGNLTLLSALLREDAVRNDFLFFFTEDDS